MSSSINRFPPTPFDISKLHLVAAGSSPVVPAIHYNDLPEVGVWRNCPKLSNKLLDSPIEENVVRYTALSFALGGRKCLGLDVHRDSAVGVTQQLLHNFYVFTVGSRQAWNTCAGRYAIRDAW